MQESSSAEEENALTKENLLVTGVRHSRENRRVRVSGEALQVSLAAGLAGAPRAGWVCRL